MQSSVSTCQQSWWIGMTKLRNDKTGVHERWKDPKGNSKENARLPVQKYKCLPAKGKRPRVRAPTVQTWWRNPALSHPILRLRPILWGVTDGKLQNPVASRGILRRASYRWLSHVVEPPKSGSSVAH